MSIQNSQLSTGNWIDYQHQPQPAPDLPQTGKWSWRVEGSVPVFDAKDCNSWQDISPIDKEFLLLVLSRTDGMTLIIKNALKDGFLREWTPEKILTAIGEYNATCKANIGRKVILSVLKNQNTKSPKSENFVLKGKASTDRVREVVHSSQKWWLKDPDCGRAMPNFFNEYKNHFRLGSLLPGGEMDLSSWVSGLNVSRLVCFLFCPVQPLTLISPILLHSFQKTREKLYSPWISSC
jgi:hypothetical protein